MNDPHGDVLADLYRWAAQERAAGRERVFVDRDAMARAAESSAAELRATSAATAAAASAPHEPASSTVELSAERPASTARQRPASPPAKAPMKPAPQPAADDNTPLPRARVLRDADRIARKAAALADLDARLVSVCTKCALHQTRTNTVFGVGHPDADLVFVGEAPGADEDQRGEPFVGRAGQLLTKILQAIGFEREDVFIANVLKCRPPNNRDPLPDEVAHCEPYLWKQLEIIEPKIICALGRISAQTLLKTRDSLTHLRCKVHDYHGIPMVVTYHPAALLRNPNWKRPTWDDVRRMRALYDELVAKAAR
jgi:uracil-DNA glycosylase